MLYNYIFIEIVFDEIFLSNKAFGEMKGSEIFAGKFTDSQNMNQS